MKCPRLESNQHLPLFRRTPSPDRLQGHRCGRGGARPRASSSIRLSGSGSIARRICSGTRTRTSTCRVKACRPAISRSPSSSSVCLCVPGRGFEPRHLRSERRGLPLADPGSRGPPGTRTLLSRLRVECFAIKACSPLYSRGRSGALPRGARCGRVREPFQGSRQDRWLPPVGIEPTHSGLKDRCPAIRASTARIGRPRVCLCGSDRTRTCEVRVGTAGLRPAPFAARMHAPPTESRYSSSVP